MTNRIELIKNIKKQLIEGKVTVGSWQQIPHSSISEIFAIPVEIIIGFPVAATFLIKGK